MFKRHEQTRWSSKLAKGIVAVAMLLGAVGQAEAFPVPLGLGVAYPDIVANVLDVNYNSSTSTLTANSSGSSTGSYLASSVATGNDIQGLGYALTANLDASGNLQNGTLSIVGGVSDLGVALGTTLLAGDLTNFGFSGGVFGAGAFEFMVNVTASASALGFGNEANIILSSLDILPSTFDETVDFSGTGNANNAAPPQMVPEPGVLSLLALGAITGFGARTSRHRHTAR